MYVLAGAGDRAEWYTIATGTPFLFIFSQSVPKNVFQRLAERIVYRLAWALCVSSILFNACGLSWLVRAFSRLLMWLSRARYATGQALADQGLAAIVTEGRASGVLTHFQSMMAERVHRLDEVSLADVMVPMASAVSAPAGLRPDELIELVRDQNYSRLPLLDSAGQVVGILDTYEVLMGAAAAGVRTAQEPLVLPAETSVTDALYKIQRARAAMAVVADPDQRHVGIVTIKDLVEEIVGELSAY